MRSYRSSKLRDITGRARDFEPLPRLPKNERSALTSVVSMITVIRHSAPEVGTKLQFRGYDCPRRRRRRRWKIGEPTIRGERGSVRSRARSSKFAISRIVVELGEVMINVNLRERTSARLSRGPRSCFPTPAASPHIRLCPIDISCAASRPSYIIPVTHGAIPRGRAVARTPRAPCGGEALQTAECLVPKSKDEGRRAYALARMAGWLAGWKKEGTG